MLEPNAPSGPHHLDVAPSLTLKPAAGLNPIEIAVNVELQQNRWMIRGPASCLGSDPIEPQLAEIELINKNVDHLNRIVLPTQSSRHSGKSVLCPRSVPSTKRFIRSLANRVESLLRELHKARRFHTSRVKNGKAQCEQMFSAFLPTTDIAQRSRHVRFVPPIAGGQRKAKDTMRSRQP